MSQSIFVVGNHDGNISLDEEDCRLSVLNFDVLEKIFEELNTEELITLCGISAVACSAIAEIFVKKRMIIFDDWNRIWNAETVFKEFGEWMKFIEIGQNNIDEEMCKELTPFEYMLHLIVKKCTKDRLRSLSLNFDIDRVDSELLHVARPFFTELRQIQYSSVTNKAKSGQEQFLGMIIDAADKLESFQLKNTCSRGNWLRNSNMKNLQNINFVNSSVLDKENWDSYFTKQPTLKKFTWIHADMPNDWLCENVARKCKNLEEFIDVQQLVLEEEHFNENSNRYEYLALVGNLKRAQITSFTRSGQDLINFIATTARNNTVEHLSVNFLKNAKDNFNYGANRSRIHHKYPHFTSLNSLEIMNHSSCMFWNEMSVNFMSELTNLREVTISSFEPISSVQLVQIALAPPNLSILKISGALTINICMAMITIGRVIEANRQQKLTVEINSQQNEHLKEHKISDFIRLVVV